MTMKTVATLLTLASTMAIHAADVNALYDKHCASCHGKDGSGKTKMGQKAGAKDYRDPKVLAELKDDIALKNIKDGMTEGGKEKMKPFKDKLSDDEIKALIGKIREFGKK
jgi:mono/diheme cytochrome c family protein